MQHPEDPNSNYCDTDPTSSVFSLFVLTRLKQRAQQKKPDRHEGKGRKDVRKR